MRTFQSAKSQVVCLFDRSWLSNVCITGALLCLVALIEESMKWIGFYDNLMQAIWWPTNALVLALLLRSDRGRWPIILIGSSLGTLFGEVTHHYTLSKELANFVGNFFCPLLAAYSLPRCRKIEDWLQQPYLLRNFIVFPLFLCSGLSGFIYSTWLYISGLDTHFWRVFEVRAVSDMLGYAMFTVFVLVVTNRDSYKNLRPYYFLNPVLYLIFSAISTWIVFCQTNYPIIFFLSAVMLLLSLHQNFTTSVLAVNLMAIIATHLTMRGFGPLVLGAGAYTPTCVILLQGFLAIQMISIFAVSITKIEREVFQTNMKLAYAEVHQLATIDSLTGIANRKLFENTLQNEWLRAIRSESPLALLIIDVDQFKDYNDRYGHPAGDACLRTIAHILASIEHRATDLVARYGGEEFVYLMPDTTIHGAGYFAESIRGRVQKMHHDPNHGLFRNISVSIGCAALVPTSEVNAKSLVVLADQALYNAKRNGRNRVELAA